MTKPQTDADETPPENEDSSEASNPSAEAAARIADLEIQLAEMKDRALREMAEVENTRRRAQKDREETTKYAVAGFAKEMLAVADNFRRALEAMPENVSDAAVKNLIAGVEATERQLLAVFDRFGIKKIEPLGQMFDPNFHRVMTEIESDQPAGTVVQVLQPGYMIHDRLLRETLVAVAKGAMPSTQHIDKSA